MKFSIFKSPILLCIIFSIIVGCTSNKKIDTLNFSMSYPPDFVVETESNQKGVIILKDFKNSRNNVFTPNIVILATKVEYSTFDEYAKREEAKIRSLAKVLESERIKFNNIDCLRLVFEITKRNVDLTYIQYVYANNNFVHALTFSCATKDIVNYYKNIDNSFLSFKIK